MPQETHPTIHVGEADLNPPSNGCPFCSTVDRYEVGVVQLEPTVSLLGCPRCGAFSVSRMPTAEFLKEQYYSRYYAAQASEKVTFDFPARLANHIVSLTEARMRRASRSPFRILDFGGGDGAISIAAAQALLTRGFGRIEVCIVDYNAMERESPHPRIDVRVAGSLSEVTANSFDLVIASAIIEHLPNARETILGLFDAMALGGGFYARTPTVVPFRTFVNRVRRASPFIDIAFPGHLHDLGPKFWEYGVRELGRGRLTITHGAPAIPQTSLRKRFFRALASYAFKAPWYVFGNRYEWIGAWEIFAIKSPQSNQVDASGVS